GRRPDPRAQRPACGPAGPPAGTGRPHHPPGLLQRGLDLDQVRFRRRRRQPGPDAQHRPAAPVLYATRRRDRRRRRTGLTAPSPRRKTTPMPPTVVRLVAALLAALSILPPLRADDPLASKTAAVVNGPDY